MEGPVKYCCIIQISQIIFILEHSRNFPEPEMSALCVVKQHFSHYTIMLGVVYTWTMEQILIQLYVVYCVMDSGGLVALNHQVSVPI